MTDIIVNVHFADLPCNIKGYSTLNADGSYTIIINARLNNEMQRAVYTHELQHINSKDFEITNEFVDLLELKRHDI